MTVNCVDYIDSGFNVFPLYDVRNGACQCCKPHCTSAGKHPSISSWENKITWCQSDIEKISLGTGYGVLCDGYLVVDIDPRNGGFESYDRLVSDLNTDLKEASKFIVETGGGGYHIYFKNNSELKLRTKIIKYEGIDFKSSGFVVGSNSLHASGRIYDAIKGHPECTDIAPQKLIDLLSIQPSKDNSNNQIADSDLLSMLYTIPSDDYQVWIDVGMSLKDYFGDEGFEIWNEWSSRSKKYDEVRMMAKWDSFKNEGIKIGTIRFWAKEYGYIPPVTFEVDNTEEEKEFKIPIVDTTKAFGLVQECIEYINSCSRFPRDHLCVSSALAVVSSLGGLNAIDEEYEVKANCNFFNVAASATGKENIQQAQRNLLTKSGAIGCVFGSIKSEQEMYKALISSQLIVYVIDEFGYLFKKISSSSGKSSASYLEGIPAAMMSIYSKSDGVIGLSSDKITEVQNILSKTIKSIKEDDLLHKEKTKIYTELLNEISINSGFVNQYMNVCGFTTPTTFNSLLTYEQATNGFIGRALVFEEKDTHPRAKKGFRKPKSIPEGLLMRLRELFTNGNQNALSIQGVRISESKDKKVVKTTQDAKDLLSYIDDYFYDWGAKEQEDSGLESITRRAFELVLKISFILAIGDGFKRTYDHVVWAFNVVKRDVENKILIVKGNMASDSKDIKTESVNKVLHSLDTEKPKSAREIYRGLVSLGLDNVKATIEYLVKKGLAIEYEDPVKSRGRKTTKYLKL